MEPEERRPAAPGARKRVGILELLTDTTDASAAGTAFTQFLRRQYYSVMPQAASVWCRELGHRVTYATYYGQAPPETILPDDLDIVLIASWTQSAALAYALARLYRRRGTRTVLGGPHAKSFPTASLAHFDIVVGECDRALIADIVGGHVDPPAILSSARGPLDLPLVEERIGEIATAAFRSGRPSRLSAISLLASRGCPYDCDFCSDWNSRYSPTAPERLRADLTFVSRRFPQVLLGFHDANFAVRFDETLSALESIPPGKRNRYITESSLSILRDEGRLSRLRDTNCYFLAPGIDSWSDYAGKSGAGGRGGWAKLEKVVAQYALLHQYVPGLQANILFGTDADLGREPVDLTLEFMRRLPFVWPGINIPTPYGGTPMFARYLREGRILRAMPIELYFSPYLATTLKHYDAAEYYDNLIALYAAKTSPMMLARRVAATARHPMIAFAHALRTDAMRRELAEMRVIRGLLHSDARFRAFHEGHDVPLPEFYQRRYESRLGRYAALLPRALRSPVFDEPAIAPAGQPEVASRAGLVPAG